MVQRPVSRSHDFGLPAAPRGFFQQIEQRDLRSTQFAELVCE
jgi:hypothetical protein